MRMRTALVGVAALVVSVGAAGELKMKKPGWQAKYGAAKKAVCIAGGAATKINRTAAHNTRWTFYGLPEGTPPPGGWPVYLIFPPWATSVPPDQLPAAGQLGHNGTCGSTGALPQSEVPVKACMNLLKKQCNDTSDRSKCHDCADAAKKADPAAYKKANCTGTQEYVWCESRGNPHSWGLEYRPPFVHPLSDVVSPCFLANGTWNSEGSAPSGQQCGFTSVNGQLWDMRIKQFLLANGIAVVQVNTGSPDEWDWDSQKEWDDGEDKLFLTKMFAAWTDGTYGGLGKGVLNPNRMGVSGYSVGAQMVSWMIQLHGTGELAAMGATVKAGAFFGGGTYACYRYPPSAFNPPDPMQPPALAQCANCNASAHCMVAGCSDKIKSLQLGPKPSLQPCCAFCCPANFTEQHYLDNPQDYSSHPATFITQHSTVDENADLCAGLNYHREMLAHGGRSQINLIAPKLGAPKPEELKALKHLMWGGDERCYCMGQSGEPAADGSPERKRCPGFLPGLAPCAPPPPPCTSPPCPHHQHGHECFYDPTNNNSGLYEDHSTERCVFHGMGFPEMVEPLTKFLMKEL